MKSIMLGLALMVFLFVGVDEARACTCVGPRPVAESLAQASAVFSGKVLEIRRVKPDGQQMWDVEVVLAVNTSWKGARRKRVSVFTHSQSAACGYGFSRGRTYLMYAHAYGEGKLSTSICTRTKRLKDAREDLRELGAGKSVR